MFGSGEPACAPSQLHTDQGSGKTKTAPLLPTGLCGESRGPRNKGKENGEERFKRKEEGRSQRHRMIGKGRKRRTGRK